MCGGCSLGLKCRTGSNEDSVPQCTEICGDGYPVGSEMCDDGNSRSGDGCSASCLVESGFDCHLAHSAAEGAHISQCRPRPCLDFMTGVGKYWNGSLDWRLHDGGWQVQERLEDGGKALFESFETETRHFHNEETDITTSVDYSVSEL